MNELMPAPINSQMPPAPVAVTEEQIVAEQPKAIAEYWANKGKDEIGGALMSRVDDYYQTLQATGRLRLYQRSYDAYYKGQLWGGRMKKAGEQSEFTLMPANHYRNILQHLVVNTTAQRPAYEPRAINTDYKSQAQVIVSTGVVEFYAREKKTERYNKRCCELSLVFAESTIHMDWDVTQGRDYGATPDGKKVKEGDISFGVFNPINVIIDFTKTDQSHDWKIIREFKNKYTMAAKYPTWAEHILQLSYSEKDEMMRRFGPTLNNNGKTDLIAVFRFYHNKTAACPNGRIVEFMSKDIVTFDGPLTFDNMDQILCRMAPDEQEGTPWGYTIGWDLLPIQEAINALYSTVITNQSNFGVQNVMQPKGAGVTVSKMVGGLNLITYNPKFGKPEALNLLSTPKEIFDLINKLENLMEVLSGVNSVVRGQPEASLKSGAALALVASQAIQFNSGLQQAYAQNLEDTATSIVKFLQKFANTKRIAIIAGKSNRSYMKEFTKEDIADIGRVIVNVGNPLAATTAGKLQIAQDLIQIPGAIKKPEQYLQVLSTGRLEPIFEGEQAQLMLIRAENEKLGDDTQPPPQPQIDQATGQPVINPATGMPTMNSSVKALMTDDHVLHIKEHQCVLASPEARSNPSVIQNTLLHIQEHIDLLKNGDPLLMTVLGQPVLPPPPPTDIPPGGGDEGAGGDKPAGNPDPTAPKGAVETADGGSVKVASMPKNPVSGEQFNNQNGGL